MDGIEEQLRAALKASGKPPKTIGEEAGVDFGAIYKFLGGRAELRSGTMARLAEWAGLTLTRAGDPASPPGSFQDQLQRGIREGIARILHDGIDDFLREKLGKSGR